MRYQEKKSLRNRIVLGALVLISITLLTVYYKENRSGFLHGMQKVSMSVTAPIQVGANKVTSPVRNSFSWGSDLFNAGSKYRKAQQQLSLLQKETVDYRETKMENVRLRELLSLKKSLPYQNMAASVISHSGDNYDSSIIIDKGTGDGVLEDMPVISPDGVVGTVVSSGRSAAEVKLVVDDKSGIAALLQESRANGIASGTGEDLLELEYIKQSTKVKVGELVVTSGMGGIFPKGLLIGVVKAAPPGIASELFRRVDVTPAVEFSQLEEVLILTGYPIVREKDLVR